MIAEAQQDLKIAAVFCFAMHDQVMHKHRRDQERGIGDAIHRPDPQAIADRRRPFVKERDEQRG